MDPRPRTVSPDPVILSGLGQVLGRCDPGPYLKARKTRKFMGLQDEMAVVAAGQALASAGLAGQPLGERAGLYLAIGCIPFEEEHIDALLDASLDEAGFSMARFSTGGLQALPPLLTFRCLPNMPAFHISLNFDLQGPYFVTYPGPGQFYVALQQALLALETGAVDLAVVGGVAHQQNFLIRHHFGRLEPPVPADRLLDGAGCLVLESASHAEARSAPVRGRLLGLETTYSPADPFEPPAEPPAERFTPGPGLEGELGPASLPVFLGRSAGRGTLRHELRSRDGFVAASRWDLP